MPDVTLITPTGDRQQAFRLCEFWMRRQTYTGSIEWIVVDDGVVPTKPSRGQTYIRREPSEEDPPHTLCANLRLALNRVSSGRVLIIEDDDYYSPEYVSTMMKWLDKADLVGEVGAKYYFVDGCRYRIFTEHEHASLCRTGFSAKVLPMMQELAKSDDWRLDLRLWRAWKGSRYLQRDVENGRAISVSMKGMPGRTGVTHKPAASWVLANDRRLDKLREWMGEDHRYYVPYLGTSRSPIRELQVYTVCVGGYDRLRSQPVQEGVSYAALTDGPLVSPWTPVAFKRTNGSSRRASRRPKILAHEFFSSDVTTLYIDANVVLVDPLGLAQVMIQPRPEAQLFLLGHNLRETVGQEAAAVVYMGLDDPKIVRRYMTRYDDLPDAAKHLAWGGCILRRPGCELFNRTWWTEYCSGSMRDQLSLSYALWNSGIIYQLSAIPYSRFSGQRCQWLTVNRHLKERMELEQPPRRGRGLQKLATGRGEIRPTTLPSRNPP